MKFRRGWIWYLAGLLLAIAAGVVAVLALRQAVPAAPPPAMPSRPIVVARQAIAAQQVVSLDAVQVQDFPLDQIPSGAIFRVEDAAGKFSLQPVEAGQPLLAQNLVTLSGSSGTITTTGNLSALLPEGKIGVVLPVSDLLGKSGLVKAGDYIDVLASLSVASSTENKGGQVTLMTIQYVQVVKTLEQASASSSNNQPPPPPQILGLVVAVDPQDAVTLKYLADAGANVSVSLRPPKLSSIFDLVPVTINYLADRFRIQAPSLLP